MNDPEMFILLAMFALIAIPITIAIWDVRRQRNKPKKTTSIVGGHKPEHMNGWRQ